MIAQLKKTEKILFITMAVAMMFFACRYLVIADVGGDTQLVSIKSNSLPGEVGRETLDTLLKLRSLTLDSSLFSDPVFGGLIDFSLELQAQPIGRNNPFAPLMTGEEYLTGSVSQNNPVIKNDLSDVENTSPAPSDLLPSEHTPAPSGVSPL